jgi:putative transcriptional regulator
MTTIHHHPTDDTLAAYLRGSLDDGRRVLVAAHIELCASCARMAAASDYLAGVNLEARDPAALDGDAIQKALARIDYADAVARAAPQSKIDEPPYGIGALSGRTLGPWRWIGPGVHWRSVSTPSEAGARVFMLKAAPGTSLPHHTHTGTELTLILRGAFSHQGGRFGVGDFDEADGTVEHQPVVEKGEDCVCLVAMEGRLRLLGLFGRLMQPFVRM